MKRIISFVLCLSMLVSMLPVSAFAAESEELIPETTVATEAAEVPETDAAEEEPAEEPTEEPTEELPVETTEAAAEEVTEEVTEEATEAATGEIYEEAVVETVPEVSEEAEEAVAEETEPEVETAEVTTVTGTVDMELDSDELLFAAYTHALFTGEAPVSYGTAAGDRLTGDRRLAYEALAKLVAQAASGDLESSVLTVGHNLGKVSVNGVVSTYTPMEEVLFTGTSFTKDDLTAVIQALLSDMPYELYWFDKTTSFGVKTLVTSSSKMFLTFSLCVSADFSVSGEAGTYDLDTVKTGAVSFAADNAAAIIEELKNGTDLEILMGYKDRICQMTDYNHDVVTEEDIVDPELEAVTPYGHPWQLIHVFDGDDDTKVVCEGYSKAFQYLCDRTETFDAEITCESVSGTIPEGRHMWNIVTIDGENYLVDVTNCDTGYNLFLAGGVAASDGSYTFDGIRYAYNEKTLANWDEELLTLADSYYLEEPAPEEPEEPAPEEPEEPSSAKDRFLDAIANAEGDVTIWDNIVLEEDLVISIPGTLYFADNASLEVPVGATLIINSNVAFNGAHLKANGSVLNYADLSFSDANSEGSFTVNGVFENHGTCWVNDGAEMNVNFNSDEMPGEVYSYGTVHVGFGKGGTLNISGGLFEAYGYLNVVDTVNIGMGSNGVTQGVLFIGGVFTFEDNSETNGYLQAGGSIYANDGGWLQIAGGLTLGNEETGSALIEIAEGGEMWVMEDVMWCDVLETGTLRNYGLLKNDGGISMLGVFENHGTVEGNGTLDDGSLDADLVLIDQLTGDGDVVITQSATINGDIEITANSVTITNGATLTLNGSAYMDDTALYADGEGSTLEINGDFFADLGSEAYFTNGAHLIVNGYVEEWRGQLEIGSEDSSAYVTVNDGGTLTKSYNREWLVYPDSYLLVNEGGTVILDTNGEVNGSLDLGGSADINGDMIVRGYLQLGSYDRDWNGSMTVGETGRIVLEDSTLEVHENNTLVVNGSLETNAEQFEGRLYNSGTVELNGYAMFSDLNNYGILSASDLHIDTYNIYNEGEININGYAELNCHNTFTNNGQINVNPGSEGTGSLDLRGDMESWGTINVSADAELTVHEDGLLVIGSDEGWQQDHEAVHGNLFVQGSVNVNGGLDNFGYIGIGDNVDDPDPYNGGPRMYVGCDGYIVNHSDGALDVLNNGTLEVDGLIENYDPNNGVCIDGLFWLNGTMDNYGHFYNAGHIQIAYFEPENGAAGTLVIHEGTSLDNFGNVFLCPRGILTVDGALNNLWKGNEEHGCIHLDGQVEINGSMEVIGDLNIPESGSSCTVTVNEGAGLTSDSIYIHAGGKLINNGSIEYNNEFIVDEGGSFEGNKPSSQAFYQLLEAFDWAQRHGTDVGFDKSVIVPVGEYDLPQLREGKQLYMGYDRGITVPAGAVLNIHTPVDLTNGYLTVEEGGVVNFFAGVSSYSNGRVTVDGEVNVYGNAWLEHSDTAVGGTMRTYGNLNLFVNHMTVSGELSCYGYVGYGHNSLTVLEGGTLNIDIATDENGEILSVGYLEAFGDMDVYGTVNLYGNCLMGDWVEEGGDVGWNWMTVYEGGTLNIESKYDEARASLTLQTNGRLTVYGKVQQKNTSFITNNGGCIEIFDNGMYDESAGFGYIEQNPAYSGNTGRDYYGWLAEGLPKDRITVFSFVDSGEDIALMGKEYGEGGYQHGAIVIEKDYVLEADLELPAGVAVLVEGGTFTIPEGVTLTTWQNVHVRDGAKIRVNGVLNIGGTGTVFSGGVMECDGEVAVLGELRFEGTAACYGEGDLAVIFSSPDEIGCIYNIPEEAQTLVLPYAISEQDIRDVLAYTADHNFGSVLIRLDEDITLSADLVIPEKVIVRMINPDIDSNGNSSYDVCFQVPAGITVTNHGFFEMTDWTCVLLEGTWEGNAPYANGGGWVEGAGSGITQEEFEALLAEAEASGEPALLEWNVYLEEDLELNTTLNISGSVAMCVGSGVTLTIGETGAINVEGYLADEEGASIVNRGKIFCAAIGGVDFHDGSYTAEEGVLVIGEVLADRTAWINGIPLIQTAAVAPDVTSEEFIHNLINMQNAYPCHHVEMHLHGEIPLTGDLELPDTMTLVIENGGILEVPEGITFTNNGYVQIREGGNLLLNGIWEGRAPENNGQIGGLGQTITHEQFVKMMEAAEGTVTLNAKLTLTEDLELTKDLVISKYGKLIVPEGLSLTNGGVIDNYGSLIVEEGASLHNGNNMIWLDVNSEFLMHGNYTGETQNWNIQRQLEGYDKTGTVDGIDNSMMTLCTEITSDILLPASEEDTYGQLRNLCMMVEQEGYAAGAGFILQDLWINDSAEIPENVYIEIRGSQTETGEWLPLTVTKREGHIINHGRVVVYGGKTVLDVSSSWEGNVPETYEGATVTGYEFEMDQYQLEDELSWNDYVYLNRSVTLYRDLVIGPNQQLFLENGGALIVPEGIRLENYGLLEANDTSRVTVEGTLYNAGTVNAHNDAVIDISRGCYEQEDHAEIKVGLWGEDGQRNSAAILGVPMYQLSVTVDGNDEALIREALAMGAESVSIAIYRNMKLRQGLYLPANADLFIVGAGTGKTATLTVPYGTTLTNLGRIRIGLNGALVVKGKLAGNLPSLEGVNARFEYDEDADVLFTQDDLQAALKEAARNGETVTVTVDLELAQDLVIPEGTTLLVSGATLTVPKGRTLTANGWLDLGGGTLNVEEGGTVVNNCGLSAMRGSRIDFSKGTYIHGNEGARVHQHFESAHDQYGEAVKLSSTVVNVPYEHIAMYYDGADESHLQMFLLMADALKPMEININLLGGEVVLSKDTTFTDITNVTIRYASLVVPNGITLTNEGRIHIGNYGRLVVRSRGKLVGAQPVITGTEDASYENESAAPEADLRKAIAAAAAKGGEVNLSSDVTLTSDLEIPENVTLRVTACWLSVPSSIRLTVSGKLILENSGCLDTPEADCLQMNGGEVRVVYSADENGNVTWGSYRKIPEHSVIFEARGCSMNAVWEALGAAEYAMQNGPAPRALEINVIEGELRLDGELYIPDYAWLNVRQGGTLILPGNSLLENNGFINVQDGGRIIAEADSYLNNFSSGFEIYDGGFVHIQEGARLNGSHPGVFNQYAEYINDNHYDQDYLELQMAESRNGLFILSQSIELERDLWIPEGNSLLISGRDNFLIIPEGVTVYNEGTITNHMFGGILAQGGELVNEGFLNALNWGVVDMGGGLYQHGKNAMVVNYHWAYAEDSRVSHPTVLGISPEYITFEFEGDDEYILHEMMNHARLIMAEGMNPAGFNGRILGDMRLTSDEYLEGPCYLLIDEGSTLTVASGATLYVYGILDIQGQLIIEEGGRVVAYRAIEVDREDAIINNSDTPVNTYNPEIPLERFEISASAAEAPVGTSVDIRIDVMEPANANVVDLHYEIIESQGYLVRDGYASSSTWDIASVTMPVSVFAMAPGNLTVKVTPIIGYDDNGEPIFSELYDTITFTAPELFIDSRFGEKQADLIVYRDQFSNYSYPGLFAGSYLDLHLALTSAVDFSTLETDQLRLTVAGDGQEYVTVTEVETGKFTVAVSEELQQRKTVKLIAEMADGSAPTTTLDLGLIPVAERMDILRDGWTVTDETVLFDLTAEGQDIHLEPSADPADALLRNYEARDPNYRYIIRWSSSDENIATVDYDGNVHFTGGLGDVTITMEADYDRVITTSVTFRVVRMPEVIGLPQTLRRDLIGGAEMDLAVQDMWTEEILDASLVRWFLCDRSGEPISGHAYARITEDGHLTTRPVANEVKVYLMAETFIGGRIPMPVEITLHPAVNSVQILDVNGDPINNKHLLYDLHMMGSTYQLGWSVQPYAGAVDYVTWTSDNPDVAWIDENGLIHATGAHGDVNFTLAVMDLNGTNHSEAFLMSFGEFTTGFAVSAQLPDGTVTEELDGLTVHSGEKIIFSAESLNYLGQPTGTQVRWTVSDTDAATVKNGVLTAKAVTVPTEITVTLYSDDQFASWKIPVVILPDMVDTDQGAMEALILCTDFAFLNGTQHRIATDSGEQLYAMDLGNGEFLDVTWTSSNEDIACVYEGGWLETYGESGTVIITAEDGYGRRSSFTLVVGRLSEFLQITSDTGRYSLSSGEQLQLTGTVSYSDGTQDQDVIWSMADARGAAVKASVATLDENGLLTAAEGLTRAVTVTVWAIPADGNPLADEFVSVTIYPAATGVEILLDNTDISNTTLIRDITKVQQLKLKAMVYPYHGSQLPMSNGNALQQVEWISSDDSVVTVAKDGTVTFVRGGTVTITARSGKAEASFQLVLPKLMDTLELPETASVTAGEHLQMTALPGFRLDSQAENQELKWTMTLADEKGNDLGQPVPNTVAYLDLDLLVTCQSLETRYVLITAEATDGSGLKAQCFVTIEGVKPVTILRQPVSVTVAEGETAAVSLEAQGDGLTYEWYFKNADGDEFALAPSFTGAEYSIEMSQARDGRMVYCVVTDRYGCTATSDIVSLNMIRNNAQIVTQPVSVTVAKGEKAEVSFEATGDGLTYEWYYRNAGDSTFIKTTAFVSNSYSVAMSADRNGREVYCVVTDAYGNQVQTDTVSLNMIMNKAQIVTQPVSVTVAKGETAEITFEATGDGLTYTWYFRNAGSSSFSKTTAFVSNSYSVTMSADRHGREVYCVVTDAYGNQVQTDTVSLNMIMNKVQIVTQPVSVTVAKGEKAEVSFEATGDGLTYAWYYRNAGDSSFTKTGTFTSNSYSISMSADRNGREVYCIVTDAYGNKAQTDTVSLNMIMNTVQLITQPVDVEAANGEDAVVTVEATGDGLTYAWYYRNPGASKFSLTTSFKSNTYSVPMSADRSGRQVYCVITDAYGNSVTTDTVTLTMQVNIVILQQPVDVCVSDGETAEVTVVAEGEGLTYQWYFKNPGSTKFSLTTAFKGNTYSVAMSAARDGRQVYCVITDVDGASVQTDTVTLSREIPQLAITKQPTDVAVRNGETAAATVEAVGDGLTYAWYYCNPGSSKFTLTTAFTGPTYSVAMSAARSGRQIYCVVSDAYGNSVTSDTVTLSLVSTTPLVILQQPESVAVASGERAEVTVVASGEGLTYEWYYANAGSTKFTKTASFTGNSYYISMNADRDGRRVYCIITDADGTTVQTNTVTLSLAAAQLEITRQPEDVTVALGQKAVATVEVTGEGLTYEWYFANPGSDSFAKTASFTGPSYSVTMSESRNGRRVYCVITDADGNSVTSNIVTLGMLSNELAIVKQPVSVSVASGEVAEVTVEATGEGLTYQWYFKNAGGTQFALTNAFTDSTYSVTMSAARSGRQVYCVITDVDGNSVTSDIATLTMA